MQIIGNKVIVSRDEVASFNRGWPCSTLRETRDYWFDFDNSGDLVDTAFTVDETASAVRT